MTTENNELTLELVADDLDTTKDIMMTLARQYERIDRTLDRTVTAQQENQVQIQANSAAIQANEALVQANSLAIQANSAAIAQLTQSLGDFASITNQRQAETDQRFNVLLEEVRYLIRNLGSGGSNGTS